MTYQGKKRKQLLELTIRDSCVERTIWLKPLFTRGLSWTTVTLPASRKWRNTIAELTLLPFLMLSIEAKEEPESKKVTNVYNI